MDIEFKKLVISVLLSIFPAFVGYFLIGTAAGGVAINGVVFIIIWAGLGLFLYQKESAKAQASSMFFILSIETLLTPLVFLIYTFVFSSGQTTGAAEATGAAIGGAILVGIAFFIGVPLAGVFYLISKRIG